MVSFLLPCQTAPPWIASLLASVAPETVAEPVLYKAPPLPSSATFPENSPPETVSTPSLRIAPPSSAVLPSMIAETTVR